MTHLPGHRQADIPEAKLRYCLDEDHPTGRHKARVFRSALGLALQDAKTLERILRDGIAVHQAHLQYTLIDGTERWVVEWVMLGRLGPVRMVSAWDRERRAAAPRLMSCYLKTVKR